MTPGSRIKILADLLERFYESKLPADVLLSKNNRTCRFIGSKDRQFFSQHFFAFFRNKGCINGLIRQYRISSTPLTEILVYFLYVCHMPLLEIIEWGKDSPHAFGDINQDLKGFLEWIHSDPDVNFLPHEGLNIPFEFMSFFEKRFGNDVAIALEKLNEEASLDLRVNTLKANPDDVVKVLFQYGLTAIKSPYSPLGVRLNQRILLTHQGIYKQGKIEIQDEGSQITALLCNVAPGMHVIDLCAGAGGKTLVMAAQMKNKGRLIACDIDPKRLENAKERVQRAGGHNVQTHLLNPADNWLKDHQEWADCVVVDAPCSGTGVWRRSPDARWRLSLKSIDSFVEQQRALLKKADVLVKKGGRLVYITCSLFMEENENQVRWFLDHHPEYTLESIEPLWKKAGIKGNYKGHSDYLVLSPYLYQTDGLFLVSFFKAS